MDGLHIHPSADESVSTFWVAAGAAGVLLAALFLDEVTSTMHLFYRERLGSVFVVYRTRRNHTFEVSRPRNRLLPGGV